MIHRMGNGNGDASSDALWWVLGGTAATVTLYQLFKPRMAEQAAFVYTKEPFVDMNAVAVRFGQLRDLWSMGYLSPAETVAQLEGLTTAISDLQKAGKASPASAQELVTRIDGLIKDVLEYQMA
jgi:hypothetical protein